MEQGKQVLGQPMLETLVKSAETWLKRNGVKPGKTVKANAEVYLTGEILTSSS